MSSRYRYQGINLAGQLQAGEIDALDEESARYHLQAAGIQPQGVAPLTEGAMAESSRANSGGTRNLANSTRLRSAASELVVERMLESLQAGVPLTVGLASLAEESPPGSTRRGLRRLIATLKSGTPLPQALREAGLGQELLSITDIGLRHGCLEAMYRNWLTQMRVINEVRRHLMLALWYPAVLCACAAIIVGGMLLFIVPQMREITESFGIQVPWMTLPLWALSRFLENYIHLAMPVLVLAILGAWLVLRNPRVQRRVLDVWRQIPLLGKPVRWFAFGRYARLMGILIGQEVRLPEALQAAGDLSHDQSLAAQSQQLSAKLSRGLSIDPGDPALKGFPLPLLMPMAHGGDPVEMQRELVELADWYDRRARVAVMRLTAWSEPVIIILTGLIVGWVVVAALSPLLKLLNDLS